MILAIIINYQLDFIIFVQIDLFLLDCLNKALSYSKNGMNLHLNHNKIREEMLRFTKFFNFSKFYHPCNIKITPEHA